MPRRVRGAPARCWHNARVQRYEAAPWIGPALALCAASPAWILLAAAPPTVRPLGAVVALGWLTYGAISWIAVLTADGSDRWVSDEPTARSLGVWTAIGGYTAAPAIVLVAPLPVVLFAALFLVGTIVLVSPRLSDV